MQMGYATKNNREELYWILIKFPQESVKSKWFFFVKDRNSFYLVNIGKILMSSCATYENITDDLHSMK